MEIHEFLIFCFSKVLNFSFASENEINTYSPKSSSTKALYLDSGYGHILPLRYLPSKISLSLIEIGLIIEITNNFSAFLYSTSTGSFLFRLRGLKLNKIFTVFLVLKCIYS